MNRRHKSEFIHSWPLFIISFVTLLFILINRQLGFNLPLLIFAYYLYFKNGLTLRDFLKFFSVAFFFSFGLFVLNIIYPSSKNQIGETVYVFGSSFYKTAITIGLMKMQRIFIISLFSMSSARVIDYTKLILYLIVHKGLKLFWGYPFILCLNSIALFKNEFNRIRLNVTLRNLPLKDQLSVFFPLLVFAIRHSQRGALALVSRGLNTEKSFYYSYDVVKHDKIILTLFWCLFAVATFFRVV